MKTVTFQIQIETETDWNEDDLREANIDLGEYKDHLESCFGMTRAQMFVGENAYEPK